VQCVPTQRAAIDAAMSAPSGQSMPYAEVFEALYGYAPPNAPRRPASTTSEPAAQPLGTGGDSTGLGYDYISFGAWDRTIQGYGVGAGFGGQPTPPGAVPSSGSAKFTGHLIGIHQNEMGSKAVARANVLLDVNFSSRSVGFASNSTTLNGTATPRLDLSGTMTYPTAGAMFEGTLRSAGGTLTGTASGGFYGPRAEEAGGTFNLNSSGRESLVGAFGTKR
jgi:hypothetical protein